jgi:hypothetical protein
MRTVLLNFAIGTRSSRNGVEGRRSLDVSQFFPQLSDVRNSQSGLIGLGRQKNPILTACRHPFPFISPLLRSSLFIPYYCLLFISFLSALVFCQRPFFLFLSCLFFSSFVSGVCAVHSLAP